LRVHLHVCRKINTQARWDPTQALGRIFGQVIFYFLPRERCEYFLLNLTYIWEICSFHYLAHSPSPSGLFSDRLHQVLRLLMLTGTLTSIGNLKPNLRACPSLFTHAKSTIIPSTWTCILENWLTVDAMEVLIKYCTNSFLKLINSFDRKLINFLLLSNEPIRFRFRTDWPIRNAQEVKRNLNSYELINLRKWILAIFYQHFHCINSKGHWQ
jgi:hypothetical protein